MTFKQRMLAFHRLFACRRAEVQDKRPDLQISLIVGRSAEFPEARNFAYCAWDGKASEIVFSPKVLDEPKATQDALIRHELAHAMLQSAGLSHNERECDAVAEEFWGDLLYYNADDVQTLTGGIRPRPSHLPNPGGI